MMLFDSQFDSHRDLMTPSKKVLYLDQAWASELAKADSLPDWSHADRGFYLELRATIEDLVERDLLVCPTSEFHNQEAEQGTRVRDFLWHVVRRLSKGLSFRNFTAVVYEQVADAARRFCGAPAGDRPWWAIPFDRDPNVGVAELEPEGPFLVHFPTGDELVAYQRASRRYSADEYSGYKRTRRGLGQTLEDEIEFGRSKYLEAMYSVPQHVALGTEVDDLMFFVGASVMRQDQAILAEILRECGDAKGLVHSAQMEEVPFLYVRSRLVAADIVNFPDHDPEPSLGTDFDIVATTLPFSDYLATDAYMTELIRQTKLDEHFGCMTFSMKRKDELLSTLRALGSG